MYQTDISQNLTTTVSLSFSCKGLLNKDTFSKSDPIIQVLLEDCSGKWLEVGRTEKIKNCNDPDFVKTIEIGYKFEEVQKLKILVYDIDNETQTLDDDDFLGQLQCKLGQVVSAGTFTQPLQYTTSTRNAGTITIIAEEIKSTSNDLITLQFQGNHLDKKDFFGKSDPYLEFQKDRGNGAHDTVHRTPHIKNTLNPQWKAFTISLRQLCSGNYDMKLRVQCFDYDNDGSHDFIGEFYVTVAEILQKPGMHWELINPKKKQKKSYKNSGVIILNSAKVEKVYSFLDFVLSGCQINFTVGIDFTASNGDPTQPSSLHYCFGQYENEYVTALRSVGEICEDYDTDKMFPALGFGATLPPTGEVSFEFALNFNPNNPYCHGIQGVIEAYHNCLRHIRLYGPTNVAPLINHVVRISSNILQGQENTASNYFILLLLTDGVISDMANTIEAIVNASYHPISIIIVGVGGADFKDMEFLDCDNGKLRSSNGKEALRDIVQFVPFRNFKSMSKAALASSVLAEVPQQVSEYYKLKRILPNPPPAFQPPIVPTL